MHASVEDSGRYTCVVSNSAGEERKDFDMEILGNVLNINSVCVCVCVYGLAVFWCEPGSVCVCLKPGVCV